MTHNISIDTANKMLLLVRPITEELTNTWIDIVVQAEKLKQAQLPDSDDPQSVFESATEMHRLVQDLNRNIDELEQLGCVVESFDRGTIDFPSILENEPVMLCWTLGENEVFHYHRLGENARHRLLIKQVLE
jgi:hypothetical protein